MKPAPPHITLNYAVSRSACASGAPSWLPFGVGFGVYSACLCLGYFLKNPVLNIAGAGAMLYVSSLGYFRHRLAARPSSLTLWALFVVAAFFMGAAQDMTAEGIALASKYALLFGVFIMADLLRLGPIAESPSRNLFLAICIALLAVSAVSGDVFELSGDLRLKGLFANPNNLALFGLSLLFFLKEGDSRARVVATHCAVLVVLVLTNTSGAILAYAIGMAFRFRERLWHPVWLLALILFVTLVALTSSWELLIPDRVARQFLAMKDGLGDVLTMSDVAFGDLAETHGDSALSGLWRIATWKAFLLDYARSGPTVWLFGHGIGASRPLHGHLPHNDFIRVVVECGAVGAVAYIGFLATAMRRLTTAATPPLTIFVVYSMTENNLDNFLFMTLLMLFIAGSTHRTAVTGCPPRSVNKAVRS